MSLIAAGGSTEAITITNASFFPDLQLQEFRESMRIDSTVTDQRAVHALEAAMYEANQLLSPWMQEKLDTGVDSITNVPQPAWQPEGYYKALYLRAVWSLAKSNLVERYRDYDTTGTGHDRAEALEMTDDDYRRDAAWALSDIRGRPRTTVELI